MKKLIFLISIFLNLNSIHLKNKTDETLILKYKQLSTSYYSTLMKSEKLDLECSISSIKIYVPRTKNKVLDIEKEYPLNSYLFITKKTDTDFELQETNVKDFQ